MVSLEVLVALEYEYQMPENNGQKKGITQCETTHVLNPFHPVLDMDVSRHFSIASVQCSPLRPLP